ncbi:MAG: hypothetical protein RLY71_3679 [Pseudomonadota bacterium]|jgi:hypothetical protein
MPNDTTRWSVTVSRDTDLALRTYLGAQGVGKSNISKFVEDAVRWRMLDQAVQAVKERHADIPADDLQAAIDEACSAVQHDMWPKVTPTSE